jgi:uncharacterized protein YdeI (YjbR/CyaY-like superfamily)
MSAASRSRGPTAAPLPELECATAARWRAWLKANHGKSRGVWLVYRKGEAARKSLTYGESLEEALCWGWIDSVIHRLDDLRYARKFTPRRPGSNWSPTNKRLVQELERAGRMREPGRSAIAAAKSDGSWDRARVPVVTEPPAALAKALAGNPRARARFDSLPPSHRTRYLMWISTAKKAETVERRVREAVATLAAGRELGLK